MSGKKICAIRKQNGANCHQVQVASMVHVYSFRILRARSIHSLGRPPFPALVQRRQYSKPSASSFTKSQTQRQAQRTLSSFKGSDRVSFQRSYSESHWKELTRKDSPLHLKAKETMSEEQESIKSEQSADSATAPSRRPQFGNRYLENPDNVFQHNAWDNVTWDPEQLEAAKKKVEENSCVFVDSDKQESYELDADRYWDEFYSQHQNKFFKDRHWLFTEFPELSSSTDNKATQKLREVESNCASGHETDICKSGTAQAGSGSSHCVDNSESASLADGSASDESERTVAGSDIFPGHLASRKILEVGCGVGNTIFPILQTNADPGLFVYGCDFSPTAVDIVRQHAEYDGRRCHAFVCDVSAPSPAFPFPNGSLDVVVMIFVLSAVNPGKFRSTVDTVVRLLRPGGLLLFRDYGRYDMAQLRFKRGRCLADNFYVRGDGTRVYFFTQEELRTLFVTAGLTEEQNLIDRRLQVNRGRQLTMYRVWIQCKYKKPEL